MHRAFVSLCSLVAALSIAVSISGCLLQPTESSDCGAAVGCGECITGYPGCGWCGSTSSCVAGSTFGPDVADCPLSAWRFTGCSEPSSALGCGAKEDCNSCLFDLDGVPGCTWCAVRGECIPNGASCVSGVPVRDYDMCSVQNCAAQPTCGACLAADCDWCDQGGGSCTNNASGCDAHYRFWSSDDTCPPPNTCSSHFDCGSCLADSGCGWCDAPGGSGFCQASNGFGDYADWCSSGDFTTDAFSCP